MSKSSESSVKVTELVRKAPDLPKLFKACSVLLTICKYTIAASALILGTQTGRYCSEDNPWEKNVTLFFFEPWVLYSLVSIFSSFLVATSLTDLASLSLDIKKFFYPKGSFDGRHTSLKEFVIFLTIFWFFFFLLARSSSKYFFIVFLQKLFLYGVPVVMIASCVSMACILTIRHYRKWVIKNT